MWTIYSIGDVAFLEMIINAVAAIAGTGSLEQVFGIGLLLGLIILGFESVLGGGTGIKFQNAFVAFILFSLLFGPRTDVMIEDVYSGEVRIVDNVPLGVAAAGGISSGLGVGITQLFEQAYTHPEMTERGFGSAILAMASVRKSTLTKSNLGSANSPVTGDDIWKSWANYIKECTLVGVDNGDYTISEIEEGSRVVGGSPMQQLQFNSMVYGTKLHLAGVSSYHTCTDAYPQLADATVDRFIPSLYNRIARDLNLDLGADAEDLIRDSFNALNSSVADSENYMLATALQPMFEWGMVENEVNFQRTNSAAALHTAIQKRNESWAAEQALFETVARPMMTFFEGLIYAITPLMAFLLGLGPMGIKLIGKYLMIAIWIQLWMPTMSIVSLYLSMTTEREMASISSGALQGVRLDSFYGVNYVDQALQSAIATGGMLAASVPGITLMLVYGSAVAATSLSNRMSSSSEYATDVGSPAVAQKAASLAISSAAQSSPTRGVQTPDSPTMDFALGSQYSSGQESRSEEMRSKAQEFTNAFSRSTGISAQAGQDGGENYSRVLKSMGSESEAYKSLSDYGREISEGTDIGRNLTNQDAAKIGLAAVTKGEVTAGLALFGSKAAIGQTQSHKGESESGSTSQVKIGKTDAERINSKIGASEERSSQVQTSLAQDYQQSGGTKYGQVISADDREQLGIAAKETVQASNSFRDSQSIQGSLASNQRYDARELPGIVGNMENGGQAFKEDLASFYKDYGNSGATDAADSLAAVIHRNSGGKESHEDAALAGKIGTIMDPRFLDNIDDPVMRDDALDRATGLMSQLFGKEVPLNSGIESVNQPGELANITPRVDTAGLPSGTGVDHSEVTDRVERGLERHSGNATAGAPIDNGANVDQFYQGGKGNVDDFRSASADEMNQRNISQTAENVGSALSMAKNQSLITQGVEDRSISSPSTIAENGFGATLLGNLSMPNERVFKDAEIPNNLGEMTPEAAAGIHKDLTSYFEGQGYSNAAAQTVAAGALPEAMVYAVGEGNMNDAAGGIIASIFGNDEPSAERVALHTEAFETAEPIMREVYQHNYDQFSQRTGDDDLAMQATDVTGAAWYSHSNAENRETRDMGIEAINNIYATAGFERGPENVAVEDQEQPLPSNSR